MEKVKSILYYLTSYWYYKLVFGKLGRRSRLFGFITLEKPNNMYLGDYVRIGKYAWLAANPLTNETSFLTIGNGTYIGNFSHIYCTSKITIEANVLIADKVYISDNLHGYDNINIPIMSQPIKQLNSMKLGEGCWIGENVCIIGANVGKNSVVGANSVVTKDIPDYCIAVGSPAKVIKRFNMETKVWEKVIKNK
ncbi:acyltransferase [Pedobacter sp. N23S346]|uniref:acyltransferase n=1 Tax=Pedobacter sp. N23S346 TaxID=3402750 RepID=UPI003ACEC2B8